MKLFVIILLKLALVGCASLGPELSCEGTNWYELGRQVGRQGQSLDDKWDLKSICGNEPEAYTHKLAILETGYQSGLAEFCSSENAFNLGRLGLAGHNDCPLSFKKSYQKAYEYGRRYSNIEQKSLENEKKIEALSEELGDAGLSLAKRALREGQRLELLDEKDSLLSELKALEESAESSQANQ